MINKEEEWVRNIGHRDGYWGGIEAEGSAALRGRFRSEYIQQYHEGFLQRKYMASEITEEEYLFYDPYPGRWGAYTREGMS